MGFLKIALFVCVVVGQAESTVTNGCTGPPPPYNNSAFDNCTKQMTGGCNCTATNETCMPGDRLFYKCNHGTELDFLIVCNYIDVLGNRYGWVVDNVTEKFENCTGSPAPVQATPIPQPTAPPFQGCIRLVKSQTLPNETTGILQMEYNGTWGSVCHTGTWTRAALTTITCRMLGFNSYGSFWERPLPIIHRPLNFSTDAWEVNIDYCTGEEPTLWSCTLALNKTDWLTYAEFGIGDCHSLLTISCKVNTTLPDLTYCPPTTTTPNPTTSTNYTEESPGNRPPASVGFSRDAVIAIIVVVALLLLLLIVCLVVCNGSKRSGRDTRRVATQRNTQRRAAVVRGRPIREHALRGNNSKDQEPPHEMGRFSTPSDDRNHNQVTHNPVLTTVDPTDTPTEIESGLFEEEYFLPRTGPTEEPPETELSPNADDCPEAQSETSAETYIHEPGQAPKDLKTESTQDATEEESVKEPPATDIDQEEDEKETYETEPTNVMIRSTEASAETDSGSVIAEQLETTSSPTGRCGALSSDTHRAAWTESTEGPTGRDSTQPTGEPTTARLSQTGRPRGRLSSVTNPVFPQPDQCGPLHQDTEILTDNLPASMGQGARVQDDLTEEDL